MRDCPRNRLNCLSNGSERVQFGLRRHWMPPTSHSRRWLTTRLSSAASIWTPLAFRQVRKKRKHSSTINVGASAQRLIEELLHDERFADHWMSFWLDLLAENPTLLNAFAQQHRTVSLVPVRLAARRQAAGSHGDRTNADARRSGAKAVVQDSAWLRRTMRRWRPRGTSSPRLFWASNCSAPVVTTRPITALRSVTSIRWRRCWTENR